MATLSYPVALAATLVVEVPVWTGLLHVALRLPWHRAVMIGAGVNVVSHPVFWFVVFPVLSSAVNEWAAFAISEIVVVAAETAMVVAFLRRQGDEAPLDVIAGVALSANLLSIAVGFLLQLG